MKDLRIGEMKHGGIVEYNVFLCAINNTNKLDFKKKRPSRHWLHTFLSMQLYGYVRIDGPYYDLYSYTSCFFGCLYPIHASIISEWNVK